jgi:hypothetical protein
MPPLPPSSRRSVLAAGLGLGAAGVLPLDLSVSGAAGSRSTPARADVFARRFGLVVHLHFLQSVYADHDQVLAWLKRLGVRHVRTRLSVLPSVLDAFEEYARHGIRIQGVCGAFGDDQEMDDIMRTVSRRFARPERVFSAFEGINEPNNDGVPWIRETRRKTRALYWARRRHGLGRIPIVAPALARVTEGGVQGDTTLQQARRLGDLSRFLDQGNMHVYPRGLPPSADIAHFRRCARLVAPGRPVMCTEGGYFTAMRYQGGANPVPEAVAAVYGPQAMLEHWLAGTRRFFRYELLDEPDAGPRDREGTLGMIRTGDTWRPKPDFGAVQRLLSTLDDPGGRYQPAPLSMSLTNRPRDLKHAAFARRDGSHVIALWLDRVIYDPRERSMLVDDLDQPLGRVCLELGRARDITVRHVNVPGEVRRGAACSSTRIDLPAGVTLVTLR